MSDLPPLILDRKSKIAIGLQLEMLYHEYYPPARVPRADRIPTDRFCELFGYVMGYERK